MTGIGSGNWCRWERKRTTEEVKRIDVRYMYKHDLLRLGAEGDIAWSCRGKKKGSILYKVELNHLVVMYHSRKGDNSWQYVEERVAFDRTQCHYGGERLWFLCPKCQKRVAVLFGAGTHFLCRHCYHLPYSSQLESYIDRMMRKARKIRRRLKASVDLMLPISQKPRGMHRKTFDDLVRKEREVNQAMTYAMAKQLGISITE